MPLPIAWTPELDAALLALRCHGLTWDASARALGVSRNSAMERARCLAGGTLPSRQEMQRRRLVGDEAVTAPASAPVSAPVSVPVSVPVSAPSFTPIVRPAPGMAGSARTRAAGRAASHAPGIARGAAAGNGPAVAPEMGPGIAAESEAERATNVAAESVAGSGGGVALVGDVTRGAMRAGHAVSWGVLIAGSLLVGSAYPPWSPDPEDAAEFGGIDPPRRRANPALWDALRRHALLREGRYIGARSIADARDAGHRARGELLAGNDDASVAAEVPRPTTGAAA